MKIFFLMRSEGYIRNFESVIDMLSARGHTIHLCFLGKTKMLTEDHLCDKFADNPLITYSYFPDDVWWLWNGISKIIRIFQDYLRYLDPVYCNAHKLRARAGRYIPSFIQSMLARSCKGDLSRIWRKINRLRWMERIIPVNQNIVNHIKLSEPDIFLITPLVDIYSNQVDWLKAAQYLGIPSIHCVASWDNLTNKGLIKVEPDGILVWNEFQKREAVEMHHVPAEKVFVSGAQCYDKWFTYEPKYSRKEFCAEHSLDPSAKMLLYVCSSPFIAPDEVGFIRRWIEKIRFSEDTVIAEASIMVRPHPQNARQWDDVDFSSYGNVTIYPREGANPIDARTRDDFYHSIYFCDAVCGINTSAMIESGILKKPVFTIVTDDFADTQGGTLHFDYLVNEGGLVYQSSDFDEHLKHLRTAFCGKLGYEGKVSGFLKEFLRPSGLEKECTPIFCDIIEKCVKLPCRPVRHELSFDALLVKPLLFIVSVVITSIDNFRFAARKTGRKVKSRLCRIQKRVQSKLR
ncbi:MAG: hypothetical protein AB1454_07805 [Candidatus Auribacterota bacterium]